MGALLKGMQSAFDKSAEWAANRGGGRVVRSHSGTPAGHCVGCGRRTNTGSGGVTHCKRDACIRKAALYV